MGSDLCRSSLEICVGPSVIFIYISNLSKIIQSSQIRMFADDACLFCHQQRPRTSSSALNRDLDLISKWAHQWLVTFIPPKTESMLLSSKKDKD